jgi:hypothetical protein
MPFACGVGAPTALLVVLLATAVSASPAGSSPSALAESLSLGFERAVRGISEAAAENDTRLHDGSSTQAPGSRRAHAQEAVQAPYFHDERCQSFHETVAASCGLQYGLLDASVTLDADRFRTLALLCHAGDCHTAVMAGANDPFVRDNCGATDLLEFVSQNCHAPSCDERAAELNEAFDTMLECQANSTPAYVLRPLMFDSDWPTENGYDDEHALQYCDAACTEAYRVMADNPYCFWDASKWPIPKTHGAFYTTAAEVVLWYPVSIAACALTGSDGLVEDVRCASTNRVLSQLVLCQNGTCDDELCPRAVLAAGFTVCNKTMTRAKLDMICDPCVRRYAAALRAAGLRSEEAASVEELMATYCLTVGGGPASTTNDYCYFSAQEAIRRLDASNLLTTPDALASICGPGQCTSRLLAVMSTTTAKLGSRVQFENCVRRFQPTPEGQVERCLATSSGALLHAAKQRLEADLVCARNPANDYCLLHAFNISSQANDCTLLPAAIAAAGCCAPMVNEWLRLQDGLYPANYAPDDIWMYETLDANGQAHAGAISFLPTQRQSEIDRSGQPFNTFLSSCPGAIENSTHYWERVETPCPVRQPATPFLSVPLAVSYHRLATRPALVERLVRALVADLAMAAVVSPHRIVFEAIDEYAVLSVRVQSSNVSLTNLENVKEEPGSAFRFRVEGSTVLETLNITKAVNGLRAARLLVVPTAAELLRDEYPDAIDIRLNQAERTVNLVFPEQDHTAPAKPADADISDQREGSNAVAPAVFAACVLAAATLLLPL